MNTNDWTHAKAFLTLVERCFEHMFNHGRFPPNIGMCSQSTLDLLRLVSRPLSGSVRVAGLELPIADGTAIILNGIPVLVDDSVPDGSINLGEAMVTDCHLDMNLNTMHRVTCWYGARR